MNLSKQQLNSIFKTTSTNNLVSHSSMQSLWAGQGELFRISLESKQQAKKPPLSLVVKDITFKVQKDHPRGWSGEQSQRRKIHSYHVELEWYKTLSHIARQAVMVPRLIYSETCNNRMLIVLEDLAKDFPIRFTAGKDDRPDMIQIKSCINWLANFHALFLKPVASINHYYSHAKASKLWQVGGYWHLATRPDEYQAMSESKLKQRAHYIDKALSQCRYQTIIHGDAKLANFCFDETGHKVAAVDFQYTGFGVGVKDLMLLLSSVLPDANLCEQADALVDDYFEKFSLAIKKWQPEINASEVITAWRALYPFAWADFHRFLDGWSPGHWKIGQYCEKQSNIALEAQKI